MKLWRIEMHLDWQAWVVGVILREITPFLTNVYVHVLPVWTIVLCFER